MSVSEAVSKRVSVRAFKDTPIPEAELHAIFNSAQLAPSNCNVQPWQVFVVSGEKKDALKNALIQEVMKGQPPKPDFDWIIRYEGVHKERQYGSANALYSALGIERDNKPARQMAMLKNWAFFDAPHVAFFTMSKSLNIMGAVDLGIYAQTLALLLTDKGYASCFQGSLGQFPEPAKALFNLPEDSGILFGMSFGSADKDAEVNNAKTERAELSEAVTFIG